MGNLCLETTASESQPGQQQQSSSSTHGLSEQPNLEAGQPHAVRFASVNRERGTECPRCCQWGCQCQRRHSLVSPQSTRYSSARVAATSFRFRACLFTCIKSMYHSHLPPTCWPCLKHWGSPTTSWCLTAVLVSNFKQIPHACLTFSSADMSYE